MGFLSVQDETESSQADRPQVSAAKQQLAQSYAEYVGKRTQPDDCNVPTALEAVAETDSNDREEAEGEEAEGEEDESEEEDEEDADEEEEEKDGEHQQEQQPPDSEADSSSSPGAEEVE